MQVASYYTSSVIKARYKMSPFLKNSKWILINFLTSSLTTTLSQPVSFLMAGRDNDADQLEGFPLKFGEMDTEW